MKTCTKCGVEKPRELFAPSKKKDGRHSWCRGCFNLYLRTKNTLYAERKRKTNKAWREAHYEKQKAYDAAWYAANTERKKETSRAWLKGNSQYVSAYGKMYNIANADRVKATNKAWRTANADHISKVYASWSKLNAVKRSQQAAAWYKKNKAHKQEQLRNWDKNNRGKRRALVVKRVAAKLQATPPWVDLKEIEKIYIKAVAKGLTVDHQIPLRGRDVRGLHVPWNLQLLTRSENSKKGNRYQS